MVIDSEPAVILCAVATSLVLPQVIILLLIPCREKKNSATVHIQHRSLHPSHRFIFIFSQGYHSLYCDYILQMRNKQAESIRLRTQDRSVKQLTNAANLQHMSVLSSSLGHSFNQSTQNDTKTTKKSSALSKQAKGASRCGPCSRCDGPKDIQ